MVEKVNIKSDFIFNWVLRNKLAIGSAPNNEKDFLILKKNGIDNILNLCSKNESNYYFKIKDDFDYRRYILPDHKCKESIDIDQIFKILQFIEHNFDKSKIFIHCLASVERSPIICIAWLVRYKKLNVQDAYIYLSQIHKRTNPLQEQLKLLIDNEKIIKYGKKAFNI